MGQYEAKRSEKVVEFRPSASDIVGTHIVNGGPLAPAVKALHSSTMEVLESTVRLAANLNVTLPVACRDVKTQASRSNNAGTLAFCTKILSGSTSGGKTPKRVTASPPANENPTGNADFTNGAKSSTVV